MEIYVADFRPRSLSQFMMNCEASFVVNFTAFNLRFNCQTNLSRSEIPDLFIVCFRGANKTNRFTCLEHKR